MKDIKVKDKEFSLSISESDILKEIDRLANEMNRDLSSCNPLFICVLNGAFMFASELMKRIHFPLEISFVKFSSYEGTASSGVVKKIIGLDQKIAGRTVVIVEDIVDTGHTMQSIVSQLSELHPQDIKVATLLFKPAALEVEIKPDYVAMEIPSDFIVGFGLDYDGYGRNLPDIYKIKS